MMYDFKLGMKVLKYGLNLKGAVFGSLLLLVMGVFCVFFIPKMPANGLYTGMGGMMIVQTIGSISVSSMVQTAGMKKRLQTSVPTVMVCAYMLLVHTIFLLLRWGSCIASPFNYLEVSFSELSQIIVLDAVLMVIMVVYNAVALKMFWQSTIVFMVVYMGTYFYSTSQMYMIPDEAVTSLPLGWGILLSYAVILAGGVFMYVLLKILYKKPYNKISFGALLKRAK